MFIEELRELPPSLVVADMGCGEARLGRSVPQRVHSFDLVAFDSSVTACDIAHVSYPSLQVSFPRSS